MGMGIGTNNLKFPCLKISINFLEYQLLNLKVCLKIFLFLIIYFFKLFFVFFFAEGTSQNSSTVFPTCWGFS